MITAKLRSFFILKERFPLFKSPKCLKFRTIQKDIEKTPNGVKHLVVSE